MTEPQSEVLAVILCGALADCAPFVVGGAGRAPTHNRRLSPSQPSRELLQESDGGVDPRSDCSRLTNVPRAKARTASRGHPFFSAQPEVSISTSRTCSARWSRVTLIFNSFV